MASPANPNAHHNAKIMQILENKGIRAFHAPLNSDEFDRILECTTPDIVVFDTFVKEEQFGFRVKNMFPDAIRVLDTQDLHFLRRQRQILVQQLDQAVSGGIDTAALQKEIMFPSFSKESESFDLVMRELSSIHRSDVCWLVSPIERKLLEGFGVSKDKTSLVSFAYPNYPLRKSKPLKKKAKIKDPVINPIFELAKDSNQVSFGQRRNFAFIGGFRHKPNEDAVFFLKNHIWEHIQKLFKTHAIPVPELHIYGSYPTEKQFQLSDPSSGFLVKGFLNEKKLYECLSSYRASLAPLRFGAGVKGKICDSWYASTPVVGTPIAAEGMRESDFDHRVIDPDWGGIEIKNFNPESFASAAFRLYTNEALWKKCESQGRHILQNFFSKERMLNEIQDSLQNYLRSTSENKVDWVQETLWQQQFRATEYMSKYLQLKMKNSE
jgi:glycosyltransferase involved in cell wall biosynthesis